MVRCFLNPYKQLSEISFYEGENLKRMKLMRNDMNPFSSEIFQFFFFNIHIDMRLKMFFMSRFIVKHQFGFLKKDVVGVVQIFICNRVIQNPDFYCHTIF